MCWWRLCPALWLVILPLIIPQLGMNCLFYFFLIQWPFSKTQHRTDPPQQRNFLFICFLEEAESRYIRWTCCVAWVSLDLLWGPDWPWICHSVSATQLWYYRSVPLCLTQKTTFELDLMYWYPQYSCMYDYSIHWPHPSPNSPEFWYMYK